MFNSRPPTTSRPSEEGVVWQIQSPEDGWLNCRCPCHPRNTGYYRGMFRTRIHPVAPLDRPLQGDLLHSVHRCGRAVAVVVFVGEANPPSVPLQEEGSPMTTVALMLNCPTSECGKPVTDISYRVDFCILQGVRTRRGGDMGSAMWP